jgi:hypothetical protein
VDVFPVDPPSWMQDSYNPLPGGHHGTDIFAKRGTNVRAVVDGRVRKEESKKGGLCVYLDGDDGARYYYAHLDSFAGKFPRQVRAGDLIGTVGSTGNAKGKDPHVHFQAWLGGGIGIVNPYFALERAKSAQSSSPQPETPEPETPEPAPPSIVPHGPPYSETEFAVGVGGVLLLVVGFWWLSKGKKRGR